MELIEEGGIKIIKNQPRIHAERIVKTEDKRPTKR